MKVYLLFREYECVDCNNEGQLDGVYATLKAAMDSAEGDSTWSERKDRSGEPDRIRIWDKRGSRYRPSHYIEEWPVVRATAWPSTHATIQPSGVA